MIRPRLRLTRTVLPMLVTAGALVTIVQGCRSYQMGSLMHPQVRSMAVGTFSNHTRDSRTSVLLRDALAEQIMQESGLLLRAEKQAEAILQGEVLRYEIRETAAAKVRDESDEDRDEYQPAVFQLTLEVAFHVILPGKDKELIRSQRETGSATFSRLPDLAVARREALRIATNNAAAKIVRSVTEAW